MVINPVSTTQSTQPPGNVRDTGGGANSNGIEDYKHEHNLKDNIDNAGESDDGSGSETAHRCQLSSPYPISPLKRKRHPEEDGLSSYPFSNSSSTASSSAMTATSRIPILSLDVRNLRDNGSDATSDCPDSPRTKVAEKLRGLEIQQQRWAEDCGGDGRSKRARWDSFDGENIEGTGTARRLLPSSFLSTKPSSPECTADYHSFDSSTSPLLKLASGSKAAVDTPMENDEESSKCGNANHAETLSSLGHGQTRANNAPSFPAPKKRRLPSPPPSPKQTHNHTTTATSSLSSTNYPASEPSPDSSSDSDTLGVNGIGFKPTAAIAYARAEKRRRQVNDWKAREAREDRQRRINRRRRSRGAEVIAEIDKRRKRRMVRFEEGVSG